MEGNSRQIPEFLRGLPCWVRKTAGGQLQLSAKIIQIIIPLGRRCTTRLNNPTPRTPSYPPPAEFELHPTISCCRCFSTYDLAASVIIHILLPVRNRVDPAKVVKRGSSASRYSGSRKVHTQCGGHGSSRAGYMARRGGRRSSGG